MTINAAVDTLAGTLYEPGTPLRETVRQLIKHPGLDCFIGGRAENVRMQDAQSSNVLRLTVGQVCGIAELLYGHVNNASENWQTSKKDSYNSKAAVLCKTLAILTEVNPRVIALDMLMHESASKLIRETEEIFLNNQWNGDPEVLYSNLYGCISIDHARRFIFETPPPYLEIPARREAQLSHQDIDTIIIVIGESLERSMAEIQKPAQEINVNIKVAHIDVIQSRLWLLETLYAWTRHEFSDTRQVGSVISSACDQVDRARRQLETCIW